MNKKISEIIGGTPARILTITSGEGITDAARKMVGNRVGCLIVHEGYKYVGIITERDVTRCMAECADIHSAKVKDAMTTKFRYVSPQETVKNAAWIMRSEGFRHLPVIEGNEILYVLSVRDIAFAETEELQDDVKTLTEQVFSWELGGEQRNFYEDVIGFTPTKAPGLVSGG